MVDFTVALQSPHSLWKSTLLTTLDFVFSVTCYLELRNVTTNISIFLLTKVNVMVWEL